MVSIRGYMFLAAINGMRDLVEGGVFDSSAARDKAERTAGRKAGLYDIESAVRFKGGLILGYNPLRAEKKAVPLPPPKEMVIIKGTFFHSAGKGTCNGGLNVTQIKPAG